MARQGELVYPEAERRPLADFAEAAYLDYSMYVILDRALPHIGDGLKPVQRRIVYAMHELGLAAQAKPKKSARTVGDVIGKFHPHGDAACYEAMVLMAQPFSHRYPLIDGQGNWGSMDDPKSFAAMRYTEARLTAYADLLLAELGHGTVDWAANFDGTLREPRVLPAQVPNVLVNGTTGIAVGMATDIPPHNLGEVVAACVRLLQRPSTSVAELCRLLPAPDFPTAAAIVTPPEELVRIYETGTGSLRQRASWELEEGNIVITALPYQTSPARVLEQVAEQMRARRLPWLEDLRDESDHEAPTRLVLVPRSRRIDAERLMGHLFATTDLERSFRVNLNVIGLDGRPQVRDLRSLLREWLVFRTDTVRRRLEHRLQQVDDRLHVLEGLLVAYLNVDEVIRIIRNADQPKEELMARFELSSRQAEAILELRLRHLARLEEVRIRGEQDALAAERRRLRQTLGSERRLKTLVRRELEAVAERHADARCSPLASAEPAQALSESELLPAEPVTVVLSEKGWVRAARGHEVDPLSLAYRAGDRYQHAARGRSTQLAVFLDSSGRSYCLPAHSFPSARSLGEPLASRLTPPPGATFAGVLLQEPEAPCVLASSAGYGFVARVGDLHARARAGKSVLSVPDGFRALAPQPAPEGGGRLALATSAGYLLVLGIDQLPRMTRGKGMKLIGIPSARLKAGEEEVIGIAVLGAGEALRVEAGQRHLTLRPADLDDYAGERGRRGRPLPRGYRRVRWIGVAG